MKMSRNNASTVLCRVVRQIAPGRWKFNRKLKKVAESRRKRDSVVLEKAHPTSERKTTQVIHDTWASLWTRSANSPAKPMLWQELCERPCCQARALAKAQKGKHVFLTEVLQACLKNCTPIPATPAAQSVSFEMSKPPMSLHTRVAHF